MHLYKFNFFIFCLALSSIIQANESASAEIEWQAWSDDIFKRARAQNKMVLLDLIAEDCQYCKKMDATTYRNKRVIDNINQYYLPVRVNRHKNRYLHRRYSLYGTPTTIIYNGEGREVIKKRGYLKPEFMYWMLEAVAADPNPASHK